MFVADNEPHSQTARANLKKLCESHLSTPFEIEIVDVLESHELALEYRIFLTPALVRVNPEPPVTIFGDLSDPQKVIKALHVDG